MRKMLVALALAASLLLQGILPSLAEAGGKSGGGRSSSSSGRSYSSGSRSSSSSSGKSYSSSSRSSPSKPSAPSATPPRGKSYSSGPATNPAKPPATSSAPQSTKYSSSPPSSSQKPGSSTFDAGAAAAQRKAESKESFRGRDTTAKAPMGRPSPTTPSSNGQADSSRRPSGAGSVSGKSYSSDAPSSASTANRKPTGGAYDTDAATAQRRQESKTVFTRGQQPRSTWTDSSNQAHPIDPRDRQIESLRRDLDHERWANRGMRQRRFYGDYYGRPALGPVVFYHDPYSNLFWTWLLVQSLDHRAQWAYHHRDSMDAARYRDLLAHDAQLEARLHQLEAERVARDPTYVPAGMQERDLMYSDDYVTAVYNPQPRTGYVLWVLLKIFFVISILALVTWLVFVKRWGGSER